STSRPIVSGPSTRWDRPEPGRSGRIVRCRARAPSTAVHTFEVPPRPWIMRTASPSPSHSTAMRSMNWVGTPALNRAAGDLRAPPPGPPSGFLPAGLARGFRSRPSSGGGEAQAGPRGAASGVLVEDAVLHDAEEALLVLEHGDVGHGVAVHEEE